MGSWKACLYEKVHGQDKKGQGTVSYTVIFSAVLVQSSWLPERTDLSFSSLFQLELKDNNPFDYSCVRTTYTCLLSNACCLTERKKDNKTKPTHHSAIATLALKVD
jgi:hypothetical protein